MQKCYKCCSQFLATDLKSVRRCKHTFCCKCLVEYLKFIVKPKIKCIVDDCNQKIPDNLIRECLSNDQIFAYERLSIMNGSEKAVKCITENCTFLAIFDETVSAFECDICQSPNCLKCKQRHYPNDCGKGISESAIEGRARDALRRIQRKEFEALQKEYYLLPNPSGFTCEICEDFFLPRTAVVLRNCLHTFCKDCLERAIDVIKFIRDMKCLKECCQKPLDSCEILVLVSEEKLVNMMKSEAASRFFQCKNESCNGMWEMTKNTGLCECPECNKMNCVACQDIHEGKTCDEFRKTKRYINARGGANNLIKNKRIECYLCKTMLIQNGGCGAMFCNHCGNNTCIFTGKTAGRHDPEKCYCNGSLECSKEKYYCGCTPSQPCHKDCLYGCFPEEPK